MARMRAVLRHRDFRLLWAASSASTLGDRIVFVALALYVTEIGSPSDVGIVLAAHAIPRVSAFDWMGSLALLPLGYLLAGPLGEAFGAVEVVAAGGLLGGLVALVALAMPGVWKLERLQPNSPRPSSVVDASA
jgi:MFS family permease